MNRRWLLPLVLLAAAPVAAQGQPFWAARVDWYLANYDEVIGTLERDTSFAVLPVINAVCEIWARRDGAIGAEVAPAVARALIHHPRLTLSWFRDHPADFEAWLDRMPYALLTDYSGEQHAELEALRLRLVESLGAFAAVTDNADLAPMAEAIAQLAATAAVRDID